MTTSKSGQTQQSISSEFTMLVGVVSASCFLVPAVALVAFVWKFPSIFGEVSGLDGARQCWPLSGLLVFGFPLVPIGLQLCGGIAGFVAHRMARPKNKHIICWTLLFTFVADILVVLAFVAYLLS